MDGATLWGYIVGGIGALIGVLGWIRSARGDAGVQANWMGSVNAKLDHISNELSKLNDVRERVAVIERDIKSAWRSIDELKGAK